MNQVIWRYWTSILSWKAATKSVTGENGFKRYRCKTLSSQFRNSRRAQSGSLSQGRLSRHRRQ